MSGFTKRNDKLIVLKLNFSNGLKSGFKKINKNVRVYVRSPKYKTYKKMLKKAGIGSRARIYKIRTR